MINELNQKLGKFVELFDKIKGDLKEIQKNFSEIQNKEYEDPEEWSKEYRLSFLIKAGFVNSYENPENISLDCLLLRKKITELGYFWQMYQHRHANNNLVHFSIESEIKKPVALGEYKEISADDVSENKAVVVAVCRLILDDKKDEKAFAEIVGDSNE